MPDKRRIQDIVIKKTPSKRGLNDSMQKRRPATTSKTAAKPKKAAPQRRPVARPANKKRPTTTRATKTTRPKTPTSKRRTAPKKGRRHSSAPQININSSNQAPQHIMVGLALVVVLVVIVSLFSLGAKAVVTLTPQGAQIPLDVNVAVHREPIGSQVGFDSLRFSLTESAPIEVTEFVEKNERASGTITIFNDHSTSSQRLVEETRFETPDGKIFKLGKGSPVVIPGLTVEGGVKTPGSITATVYADQPGEEYNVGLTDFVIPGFKGTSKYDNFYARSASPVQGGFSGSVPVVGDEAKAATVNALQKRIAAQTLQRARQEVPGNFVFFPEAINVDFSDPVIESGEGSGQVVRQDAVVTVALFDRIDLSTALIEEALSGEVEGYPVVSDWSQVQVSLVNDPADIIDSESLSVKFNGKADFVWDLDYEAIANELAGARKKDITQSIWRSYYVEGAEVNLRPFWQSRFPDNVNDIFIENNPY